VAENDKNSTSSWRFALRALRHRNYRLFFTGQSISLVGTWMTRLATAWLVYRLTKSVFKLGFIEFAGQVHGEIWQLGRGIGGGAHRSSMDGGHVGIGLHRRRVDLPNSALKDSGPR